jgi:hypothetical protein
MEALLRFGYGELGVEKIAAIVILFFIWMVKVVKNRADEHKESKYSRVAELIGELEKKDQFNKELILEQVFQNRFGILVDYPVIKFFLFSRTPSSDLYKYVQGRKYLEFSDDYRKLKLKGSLSSLKLQLRAGVYFISYVLSAFISLALIAMIPQISFDKLSNLVVFVLFIIATLLWVFLSLEEGSRPRAAIDLAKKYNNRVN